MFFVNFTNIQNTEQGFLEIYIYFITDTEIYGSSDILNYNYKSP